MDVIGPNIESLIGFQELSREIRSANLASSLEIVSILFPR